MNKYYIFFLIIYSFTMGLVLFGLGEMFDLDEFFTTTLPDAPTDPFQQLVYPLVFAYSIMVMIIEIPLRAFATLSIIAEQNIAVGVFILLPAILMLLAIFADLASLIRGSGT